ncbi:MAG: hypothetical protein IJ902_04150 [Prevotella sp.]|nr:hypothetical protein [Prevotella sp.]
MKLNKIFSGIMALLMGVAVLTACSDTDDYFANTTPLLNDGSVVTGSSDVTATTATFHGMVSGLEKMNVASYATGFKYGYSANALTETATAASASEFSSTLTGLLNNTVIYYQAYVTLQGKLTYTGEVKSLITTDAQAFTGGVSGVDYAEATMAGSISKYPEDAVCGIVISTSPEVEDVRAGLRLTMKQLSGDFSYTKKGLLPGANYYYAAFLDLGSGVVYGDVASFTTDMHAIDVDDEFVDMGVSVRWAKHNIGAKEEADFGGLFGFGDLTGCNPSIDAADYASADTYMTALDIAYWATGMKGTLPTADQFEELFKVCKTQWVEQNGIAGYLVTAKNGNTIFLPAAGKRIGHDISEAGVQGNYLTGTVNASNTQFAVDYEFSRTGGDRSTRAVYEAMSVRPVSVARNIQFDINKLYGIWHVDLRADGSHAYWDGPMYFYGTDDCWRNVTNNEPVVGDSWNWCPDYASNTWIVGEDPRDFGTMTFFKGENGADSVIVVRNNADGTQTEEKGTFTINYTDVSITLDGVDVLGVPNQLSQASNKRQGLKIFTQSDNTLQIAVIRDADPCSLVFNYVKDNIYSGISVKLLAVGADWGGTWGSELTMLMPEDLNGQHTVKYEGAVNGAMVTLVDFVELMKRYPDAFVRIDDIKLDGNSIKFNANNFCYGDIENNGNYRIEMFNIWGKGAKDGNVIASPFSNLTNVESDPAFTFAQSCEITFTVLTESPVATYAPMFITVGAGWWPSTWDFNDGSSFDLTLNDETGKYEISRNTFDMTYTSADSYAAGVIMTFIQVDNLHKFFPGMHAVLNSAKADGQSLQYDASKVVDTSEGDAYRLELWNCYGATGGDNADNCGFGKRDGDVIHELGFNSSFEVAFTIESLFAVPEF